MATTGRAPVPRQPGSRGVAPAAPDAEGLARPLPRDGSYTVLTLDNGFTCWIRRHHRPPRAVAFSLLIRTGSLDEADDERGISHFLEHMAFRGSANYPPGAMEEMFAARGTRLGRDHNASTGLTHTGFDLVLPVADEADLDRFVRCLADLAFRAALDGAEIERERRVIREEIRAHSRSSAAGRARILAAALPDSPLASRHPLGCPETLEAITAEALRAHYAAWRRPDLATLLVVGDVEVATVRRLVRKHFARWQRPAAAVPRRIAGEAGAAPVPSAIVRDGDAVESEVHVVSVHPATPQRTVGDLRARLVEGLALSLLTRRLAAASRAPGAAMHEGAATLTRWADTCAVARASAHAAADGAPAAAHALLDELRLAATVVGRGEMARARAALRVAARRVAAGESDRDSRSIVADLAQALLEGSTPVAGAEFARLVETLLPAISSRDARAAIGRLFVKPHRGIVAVVPDSGPTDRALERAMRETGATRPVAILAPVPAARPRRLFARRPRPGPVAATTEVPELGLLTGALGNGVSVSLRESGDRPGRIVVVATLLGGTLHEGTDCRGFTRAALQAWTEPAVAGHGPEAIRDLLGGAGLSLAVRSEEDVVELTVAGPGGRLETALQVVHLLLAWPRLDEAAFRRWQGRAIAHAEARMRSVETRLAEEALRLLGGGDPRFAQPTPEQIGAVTATSAQRWLQDVICPAPLAVAVVGDLPRARMLDLTRRYVGSLPLRPPRDPLTEALRRLAPAPGPHRSVVTSPGRSSVAAVLVGWRTVPWHEASARRVLQMAEQILLRRVRREVREAQGLSYDPAVAFSPSRAYPQASFLSATSYAAPERAEETAALLAAVVRDLADRGPGEDEMQAVRAQFADLVERAQQDPRYWARELADAALRGTTVRDFHGLPAFFAARSGSEVRDVLARDVVASGRVEVICLPSRG